MSAFNQAASLTNLFVVPLAIGRIAYLNATGSSSSEYTRVAKGVVLYFVLIYGYEPILKILVTLPESLAPSFNFDSSATDGVRANGIVDYGFKLVPNIITWTLESLIVILYHAATLFNFALAILMSAMAPVIFLLGGILNIGLGVGTFLSLLVMVSSWPIVFVACEAMRHALLPMIPSPVGPIVLELILATCKLVGPIAMAKTAIHSPVGQAMKSVATGGHVAFASGANHAGSFKAGLAGQAFSNQTRSFSQMSYQKTGGLAHQMGRGIRNLNQDNSSRPSPKNVSSSPTANQRRNLHSNQK